MKFHLYSAPLRAQWGGQDEDTGQVTGSEIHQIEMGWRLAARGHQVVSYAPVAPPGCFDRGVAWVPYSEAQFAEDGIWVLSRTTPPLEAFWGRRRASQVVWLVCHDINAIDPVHLLSTPDPPLDRLVALCGRHRQHLCRLYPHLKQRIVRSTNGVRVDLVRQLRAQPRDPFRLTWTSSHARGLLYALLILEKALSYMPQLTLHVFRDDDSAQTATLFHNEPELHRACVRMGQELQQVRQRVPNVLWRGWALQPAMYEEWLQTGLFLYPSIYYETNCITVMEAQAMGALPVTTPLWGLEENTLFGKSVRGCVDDPIVQERFVRGLIRMAEFAQTRAGECYRQHMMDWARRRFDWERVVDQWELWAIQDLK